MRLEKFEIINLFGQWDHVINFPVPLDDIPQPSLIILHGPNGVGKTTILRMLNGIMELSFDQFRKIPFKQCSLYFSENKKIEITPSQLNTPHSLMVNFDGLEVELHAEKSGPKNEKDRNKVKNFQNSFYNETKSLRFELIDINRLYQQTVFDETQLVEGRLSPIAICPDCHQEIEGYRYQFPILNLPRKKEIQQKMFQNISIGQLARKVKQFITEAQVDYQSFFATTEPTIFERIIQRLSIKEEIITINEILFRLDKIQKIDKETTRLGIEPDKWDYNKLVKLLKNVKNKEDERHVVSVLISYLEVLEARAAERWIIAERLLNFERIMNDFFVGKKINIDPDKGFIITINNNELLESQLSSGEYHLLYLMISALVTRYRGTVIAIDEPELSMHISWQRKLIKSLLDCASRAQPQFIFATHSPDIAGEYTNAMIKLG